MRKSKNYLNTKKKLKSNDDSPEFDPDNCFWESELYHKLYFKKIKNKKFLYYDDSSVLKYLFFHWVNKWVVLLSKKYVEPYKLHPLQVSDQILRWEPIFSKHVSDGLVRLDIHEASKHSKKVIRPYHSVLFRAIFLTCWKRAFILFFGLVIANLLSMSISIAVNKLIGFLSSKTIHIAKTLLLLVAIVFLQILDGLLLENLNFYIFRMIYTVHYLCAIVVYRHALTHRRVYFNSINGINPLQSCNQVLHSYSPDSECSKNPLYCPALRYQNKEISPKIFTCVFYDSFYIALTFDPLKYIVEFLTNFIYGAYLLSRHVKANLLVLYVVGAFFLFFMFLIEVFNAYIFKFILYIRDYKVTKYNNVFTSLSSIKKMLYDDIGINIITITKNNELSLIFVKIFITFINMSLYSTCINVSFYIIKKYFVRSVNNANVITDIDTAGFMTTFYIYIRIISSMFLIPRAINVLGMSYISYKRVDDYLRKCSPNFYNCENKYIGSINTDLILNQETNKLPNDIVIYYKDATFTWVYTRNDLLNKNYEPYLKNINFELKRGEIAIVTGSQGCGKSNFIKSMLGEMTLVGGSMAVVPLHTSMPIFYASQDIYLQQGTIRSNIIFGYKFDEQLYNTVLKAVELEYDISTWEKGDLRVVSDNAPSLSGGQRVRMEMARAIYAYLVFHQINKEYNNNKCSFLMCLDASFHGLDPYVSKTIFNNLFNAKMGLLLRDDLAVVLTTSIQILDTCIESCDLTQFVNIPIYNIKNHTLKFYSNLHDYVNNTANDKEYTYLKYTNTGPYHISYLNNDMLRFCSSGLTDRLGRIEVTKSKYSKSFKTYAKDELSSHKFNPYLVYMKPALTTFIIYIMLTISLNVMDYVKFVLSTNLSDYITKNINNYNDGQIVDLYEIKKRANLSLKITTIFVSIIIVLSVLSAITITVASIISSRKLHEYCINSIFQYSSSVLKIKKEISQVMTFLSCDLMMIDDIAGLFISMLLFSAIQTITNIITLSYLIPISVPFILLALALLSYFVLKKYIESARILNFGFLESLGHMNSVIENTISGSSVYRSFKKDSELFKNFIEHRDYNARTKFLLAGIVSWTTVVINWVLQFTTLVVLVIQLIVDTYTKYKMKPGYFGLSLSLCMNVLKSYTYFAFLYTCTEMLMGSIERFRYFIPPGQKPKFDKFVNPHEECILNPSNDTFIVMDKKQLLKRRAIEFQNDNKKFYLLRKLFFHPKINIIDIRSHLSPFHVGVNFRDVCVYTTPEHNQEDMILKHLTAAAQQSDIIGIIGRTGAGKTTLLSVLQNIVENRTGKVLLDGKDLNIIPKDVLRQVIGVLPQLQFIFKGWTVRRFLDPRKLFTDDEIKQALKQCGLLEFVNELPGGKRLDTALVPEEPVLYYQKKKTTQSRPIAYEKERTMPMEFIKPGFESDTLLSNTQLRTLSIARLVLYRNFFRVIIVDEPPEDDLIDETSAKSDDLGVPIYELLQKFFSHCTTLVTAHDSNVLKTCTSVWVIHEGRLVRICEASDIKANETIATIIEESMKYSE